MPIPASHGNGAQAAHGYNLRSLAEVPVPHSNSPTGRPLECSLQHPTSSAVTNALNTYNREKRLHHSSHVKLDEYGPMHCNEQSDQLWWHTVFEPYTPK